ncbi:hypothetical protein P152DRAFT_436752 [Eremomyces bilateralis CBS 781.70]|uniref:RSC complex subunit Rsc9 n=1 Tax=Eremomyces bilateralis CBS 781.70 TaxID=1392243 RepID=A0A6G1G187_9PEZI|nr:uncharacterized protein P152DRAFT_436752 [Eremomyces bilateralis CBS 781.70]KAF1811877.1 hypothetical protein P152DRAFT_436752 [Eremomyces bilateralis CBS 781.70]
MAPPAIPAEDTIERTPEYEAFIKGLEEYSEKRGTRLDKEPKIGARHLDLLKLYKRVTDEGGYDIVSDTKGNKLAWRRIASELLPPSAQIGTLAFMVKTAYYKNLAAYEISTLHKKEPPPREILEDLTAKGGDLLNRTLENYRPRLNRETEFLANGKEGETDGSDADGQRTPKDDKMDLDELANSAGARTTRSLRHNPPQRALFQPDVLPARQSRTSINQTQSPTPVAASQQPTTNGVSSVPPNSVVLANYDPKPQVPSAVKPVNTPSNNPELFRQLRERQTAKKPFPGVQKGLMMPGTGYPGANIYIRAQMALMSGIPTEVKYALHHLVKISHERGDKYRFDAFSNLAEALMGVVLEVSVLYYGVKWQVSYSNEESAEPYVLNGLEGTRNLLQKLEELPIIEPADSLETQHFALSMQNVNEAALVLRNMVLLEENAKYLSSTPLIRDTIAIVLDLPNRPALSEVKHYALEIVEQLTKFFILPADDPLYLTLLAQLKSEDRGTLITTMRALSRIGIDLETKYTLQNVPETTLSSINDFLLVDDEELRGACLDFFYQFTASVENVEFLLHAINLDTLVAQLVRLLMHGAQYINMTPKVITPPKPQPPAEMPPKLCASILDKLCRIDDPRELASQWIRMCFEEDQASEITQINLWNAYNATFSPNAQANPSRPLMNAKDFISNVSSVLPAATAQLTHGNPPKYTIRGIRPRHIPVDSRGIPYIKCKWHLERTEGAMDVDYAAPLECDELSPNVEELWNHIVASHLHVPRRSDGKFDPSPTPPLGHRYLCHWGGCTKYSPHGASGPREAAAHVKVHLPDDSAKGAQRQKYNRTADDPAVTVRTETPRTYWNTATDERNDPTGLPLASVLVLRNLARQMGKLDAAGEARGTGRPWDAAPVGVGLVEKVFATYREELYYVMAFNLSLREYIHSLVRAIAAVSGGVF